uniref:Proteasome assembly chaperone 4 n=1 Tax=Pan troglodytes TaxID=9598 RepID=A0A2I3TJ88_PANTR
MSPQLTSAFRNLPKTFVCHLNEMKTCVSRWTHPCSNTPLAMCWSFSEEQGYTDCLPERSRMFGGSRSKINSARKTNKQVFVSYNLQNTDSNFALLVENRIKEEMEAFPEKF